MTDREQEAWDYLMGCLLQGALANPALFTLETLGDKDVQDRVLAQCERLADEAIVMRWDKARVQRKDTGKNSRRSVLLPTATRQRLVKELAE